MADVCLAYTLGYGIFCLQTPVRACERVDVIFHKGIVEVCVRTSGCVRKEEVSLLWQEQVRCERCSSLASTAAETSCLSTPPGVVSNEATVYF